MDTNQSSGRLQTKWIILIVVVVAVLILSLLVFYIQNQKAKEAKYESFQSRMKYIDRELDELEERKYIYEKYMRYYDAFEENGDADLMYDVALEAVGTFNLDSDPVRAMLSNDYTKITRDLRDAYMKDLDKEQDLLLEKMQISSALINYR